MTPTTLSESGLSESGLSEVCRGETRERVKSREWASFKSKYAPASSLLSLLVVSLLICLSPMRDVEAREVSPNAQSNSSKKKVSKKKTPKKKTPKKKASKKKASKKKASKKKASKKKASKKKASKKKASKKRSAKKRTRRKVKRQYYSVVRGDQWASIARVLKVSVKKLKRWNRKYRKRKRLKPGTRLAFYGPLRRTESIGRAHKGALKNGVHLDPDGDGLGTGFAVAKHRAHLWGTPELVKLVKKCGRTYRRYFARKYAPIPIGDLSSRSGGQLKSHKSHQSGRDVDVGYMRKKPRARGYFVDTSPKQMNMYAQWVVLKCFLDDPLTQKVFIERSRVKALKRYLKRIYKKRQKKLKRYLAYFSRGAQKRIYPDQVHKSHMHVRIRCPKGDRRCVN